MKKSILEYSVLYMFLLSCLFACKCNTQNKNYNTKIYPTTIQESHAYLKDRIQDSYDISNGSSTKEEAVERYLKELAEGKNWRLNKYIYSEEEFMNILLPNTLGHGTALDTNSLDKYMELVISRRDIAEDKIAAIIAGKDFKIIEIHWEHSHRKFRVLTGYKPGSIVLSVDGKQREIDEIKQVIEHQGRYKIAVIGP